MKNFFSIFTLVACIFISQVGFAQSANELIGKLMNEQNMFELDIQRELHEKELAPMLNYYAKVMLADAFNNPEEGMVAIDTLLNNMAYQQQLGLGNIAYIIYMKSVFLESQQRYQESTEMLQSFLDQTKNAPYQEGLKLKLAETLRIHKKLKNVAKSSIKRPDADVVIPYQLNYVGKGVSLNLPARINSKEVMLCLDTGNPKYTVATKDFAQENKIRILVDSIAMKGVGSGYAQIGVADSMNIGSITYYNPLFFIVDKITPLDSMSPMIVLGSSLLNELNEFRVDNSRKELTFPNESTLSKPDKANMVFRDAHLFIKLKQDSNEVLMHFDTGSTKSYMTDRYYKEHKDFITKNALQDSIRMAGFGGVSRHLGYTLDQIPFQLEQKEFILKDVDVHTEDIMNQTNENGCFGLDLLLHFDKATISYKAMRIEVE